VIEIFITIIVLFVGISGIVSEVKKIKEERKNTKKIKEERKNTIENEYMKIIYNIESAMAVNKLRRINRHRLKFRDRYKKRG
jgi:divalent metal cation (Fe/Co/Zn/Cd) transporter